MTLQVEYNSIGIAFLGIPPYLFFAVLGGMFSISLFILLLLKHNYDIPRYMKIFLLSLIGLLLGGRFFGILTGLYFALANSQEITLNALLNTGIVFYGGLLGFLLSYIVISKLWCKKINSNVLDLLVVCIPLFHFFGRIGCFFGGCCFGVEADGVFTIIYTTRINGEAVTAPRIPIQLYEAAVNIMLFIALFLLLKARKFIGSLMPLYLATYAIFRVFIELYRGDAVRGVWNGVSFSQVVSIAVFIGCVIFLILQTRRKKSEIS